MGRIPWITPTDLLANQVKYIRAELKHISEAWSRAFECYSWYPMGSIIFSTRGTSDNLAIAGVPLTTNQSCEASYRTQSKLASFLYYLAQIADVAFHRLAGGTTFGAITRREIARVCTANAGDL